MTVSGFAIERVSALIEKVRAERARVLKTPGADAIHDLRVSLRRLEQGLAIFKKHLPEPFRIHARRVLKRWLKAAGRTRDCDIAMQLLNEGMRPQLQARRDAAAAELLGLLRVDRFPRIPKASKDLAWTPPDVIAFARKKLPRIAAEFFDSGETAAKNLGSAKRLHEFRLHGKEIRYRLELFSQFYGPKLAQLMKLLKHVQTDLGEMSDADATARILTELAAPDDLVAALHDRAEDRKQKFRERWLENVPDAQTAERWVQYLAVFAGRTRPRISAG